MDPQFTAMLATQRHLDLLAEASRERAAACAARRQLRRAQLGDRLVRPGRYLTPADEAGAPAPRSRATATQPCTAC